MQSRTRVKICGVTRLDDAMFAAGCGVDSIGLNFHRPSSRYLEIEEALRIRRSVPPFVTVTALFLDENEDWIAQVVHRLKPDCLQFHGTESVAECEAWGLPYIKAIPMASVDDIDAYAAGYALAQGFLLDSNAAGRLGGSGDTFDWSRVPENFSPPLVVAGGISPSNVADAIRRLQPWGVDVCSGVEKAPGIKSNDLVEALFCAVREADESAK